MTGASSLTRIQHRIFQRNLDINGHDRQAVLPSARVCLSLICHDCSMTVSIQATLLMAASSSFFLIKDHNSELHSCSHLAILLRSRVALKMWTSLCSDRVVCVIILAAAMLVSPSEGKTPDHHLHDTHVTIESFSLPYLTLGQDKISHLKNQNSSTIKNQLVFLLTSFPCSGE